MTSDEQNKEAQPGSLERMVRPKMREIKRGTPEWSELIDSALESLRRSGFQITDATRSVVERNIAWKPHALGYWLGLSRSQAPILLRRDCQGPMCGQRWKFFHRVIMRLFGVRIYSWLIGLFGLIAIGLNPSSATAGTTSQSTQEEPNPPFAGATGLGTGDGLIK